MPGSLDGLGLRIRTARRARGLSTAEVAVGTTRCVSTIYLWEQGKAVPLVVDVLALCALLACDVGWLLTGEGDSRLPVDAEGAAA